MSDTATAPDMDTMPASSTNSDRDLLAAALRDIADGDYANAPAREMARRALADRQHRTAPQYLNATDEYVRRTLRKRRLEEEVRRENRRITELEQQLAEEWAQEGRNKDGHAATGATLSLSRKVWAKLDVDTDGLDKDTAEQLRADMKARVGAALADVGLGDLVRPDFNLNTLSAEFRARVKECDAMQRDLPESERRPRPVDDFLPEPLRGLLKLDDTPRITVRA